MLKGCSTINLMFGYILKPRLLAQKDGGLFIQGLAERMMVVSELFTLSYCVSCV